jgi:hypothetical protein
MIWTQKTSKEDKMSMNNEEGCDKIEKILDFYQQKRIELFVLYDKALKEMEKQEKFDIDRVMIHTPSLAACRDWSEYDKEYINKLMVRPDDER